MATRKKKQKTAPASGGTEDKVEKFERHLRVILNTDQVAEYADRAAHLLSERDDKEESFKASQKQAKAEIESLEAKHRELSGYVRDKAKYQETPCERRFDYSRGLVIEKRLDTEEELSERAMTADERQLGLDLEDDAKDGKGLDDDFESKEPEAAE